ncbi:CAP domain-containing protein [Kovacikia minuta CCNUW1]|uniref:CAP domain-containing protein n=1 Tax=Kovacikia minuta TaxID=2931930 RepID=UPI001CC92173|nr:CAP domain-containing protein [Kovacikia minuta]UBF24760.1 CAP domain-containing protein [Kovacikia minuta CCNUW1]
MLQKKIFSDSVSTTDRNDYYQVSIGTKGNLNLSLNGLRANANVQLINANGAVLSQSIRTGTAREAIAQVVNPGTYYVRVYQVSGSTNYTLKLSADPISSPVPTPPPRPTPTPTPTSTPDFTQQVLDLTNQFRAQNGVGPLKLNVELNAAALTHSKNMALQDFFSHTGKDGSTAGDRLKTVGYESLAWGEYQMTMRVADK